MIKRLRFRIICVIAIIVTVLLAVMLTLICHSTATQLRATSLAILQNASPEPGRPNDKGDGKGPGRGDLCFVLHIGPNGELEARGGEYYDLTDAEMLQEIFDAAKAEGRQTGILYTWKLRYYRMDRGPGEGYAFLDVSREIRTMQSLIVSCTLIFCASIAVVIFAAWLLARWLVRPVDEAWQMQRQFVADASHELKTPLTVIMTNAELLQSEDFGLEEKQRFASSIQKMSQQMRGLVESLLQLARVDSAQAKIQLQTLCFSELAEGCVLPFEPVYFEAGRALESRIDPKLFVQGNMRQLQQLVDILLDNGQKYSRPESTVTLKLTGQGMGHCLLSVASEGEMLTQQQCKDIFKRFYRVDEARSMNRSYGLGLPIAQEIVTRHRGKIWCQSKDGINTFFVSLPTCGGPK